MTSLSVLVVKMKNAYHKFCEAWSEEHMHKIYWKLDKLCGLWKLLKLFHKIQYGGKSNMAKIDTLGCTKPGLSQGIQWYLTFKNHVYSSKVTPTSLTHWWYYSTHGANMKLGENNGGTGSNQCAKFQNYMVLWTAIDTLAIKKTERKIMMHKNKKVRNTMNSLFTPNYRLHLEDDTMMMSLWGVWPWTGRSCSILPVYLLSSEHWDFFFYSSSLLPQKHLQRVWPGHTISHWCPLQSGRSQSAGKSWTETKRKQINLDLHVVTLCSVSFYFILIKL